MRSRSAEYRDFLARTQRSRDGPVWVGEGFVVPGVARSAEEWAAKWSGVSEGEISQGRRIESERGA